MPLVQKTCIWCGYWLKHRQRKVNCLCERCHEKVDQMFWNHIAEHGPISYTEEESHDEPRSSGSSEEIDRESSLDTPEYSDENGQ